MLTLYCPISVFFGVKEEENISLSGLKKSGKLKENKLIFGPLIFNSKVNISS